MDRLAIKLNLQEKFSAIGDTKEIDNTNHLTVLAPEETKN
jgi:hypothetical protein